MYWTGQRTVLSPDDVKKKREGRGDKTVSVIEAKRNQTDPTM